VLLNQIKWHAILFKKKTNYFSYIFSICVQISLLFDNNLHQSTVNTATVKQLTTPIICEYTTL